MCVWAGCFAQNAYVYQQLPSSTTTTLPQPLNDSISLSPSFIARAPVERVGHVVGGHPLGEARLPHAVGALAAPAAPLAKADRGAEAVWCARVTNWIGGEQRLGERGKGSERRLKARLQSRLGRVGTSRHRRRAGRRRPAAADPSLAVNTPSSPTAAPNITTTTTSNTPPFCSPLRLDEAKVARPDGGHVLREVGVGEVGLLVDVGAVD